MNYPDRDQQDADLLQRALLSKGECPLIDRVLDALMWVLSILLLAMIVIAPIIWGWI